MRVNRILLVVTVLGTTLLGACSRSDKDQAEIATPEKELAATVDEWQLTRTQLEDFLNHLPGPQRHRYDSPEGRAELANKLMQEELAYREAERLGVQDEPDVAKQIKDATRTILVTAYLNEYVDNKARPSDEEMHEYYETHPDQFTVLATVRAQHIFSKSKEKLEELKTRVIDGGEKFSTLAELYSEDDVTRPDGGDLGYFNPGGYIRGIGYSQEFTDAVAKMERGKIYGPIKWEKGYSLVRVNGREDAHLRPYDEAKEEIAKQLAHDKIEPNREAHFTEVAQSYQTRNLLQEEFDHMHRGPEELFQFAQSSEDPQTRINAFQEIVDRFPDDEHAPQALFMVGFVYAEEVKDNVSADRTFNKLIQQYPDSDMAKTAKWMLQNLDKPLPKFENLDELNKKVESQGK